MVKLNKIYTRTGDSGETGLGDGTRVPKHAPRVAAYGDVDEANAVIGLAIVELNANGGRADIAGVLLRIQNDLFDVGADLCMPEAQGNTGASPLRVTSAQVDALEQDIDRLNESLEPLTSFVLPGGSATAACLHHARTVVRRAERSATDLSETERVSENVVTYLNRLSDLLFVMARVTNNGGKDDVLWRPGGDRQA